MLSDGIEMVSSPAGDRSKLPKTIDNGYGEVLVFERIESAPEGERLIVRNEVQPGAGPPMHMHRLQAESLTVVQGRLGYQIEQEEPAFAEPGDMVTFPPGVMHRFWAEGDQPLHCTGWVSPPHNIVYFLSEIFESTKANGGRPNPFDAAYLLSRYRSEYVMAGIPAPVEKLVFPLLLLVGRLTGRYAKFRSAPPPA